MVSLAIDTIIIMASCINMHIHSMQLIALMGNRTAKLLLATFMKI